MSEALTGFMPGAPTPQSPAQPPAGPRAITPNVSLTSLDDPTVKQYEFELYQGKAGYTDRIYLITVNDLVKGRVHYPDNLKGGVVCQSIYTRNQQGTQENLTEERFCCKMLGPSQLRFAALIVKYATDRNGEPVRPFSFEQRLWKFGADKFRALAQVHKDFPLTKHDLSIVCTDDTYQKMTINAKPDCYLMHPNFPQDVKASILSWAQASLPKLVRELGRTYNSEQELLQAMRAAGAATPGVTPPAPSMVVDQPVTNFSDVLGGFGTGPVVGEQKQ